MAHNKGSSICTSIWRRLRLTDSYVVCLIASVPVSGCADNRQSDIPASDTSDVVAGSEVFERGPSCSTCMVALRKVGTIGSAEADLSLLEITDVAMLPTGQVVAGPTSEPGQAVLMSTLGSTPQPFGRRGEGPGENPGIAYIRPWAADSIAIFANFRVSLLDSKSGTGRTVHWPTMMFAGDVTTLPDQQALVLGNRSRTYAQLLVVRTDGNQGRITTGFGAPKGEGEIYARALALAPRTLGPLVA